MRARIVLAAADGESNTDLSQRLGLSITTVRRWRNRFAEARLDGLVDEPRPGRPRVVGDDRIEALIAATLETHPAGRHALVDALDGRPPRIEPVDGVAGLAGVRTGSAQTGFVEAV